MKKVLLPTVFIIFLAAVGVWYFNSQNIIQKPHAPVSPTPSSLSVTTPTGWKPYQNPNLGVSFAVPPDFEISQNGEYSITASPKNNTPRASDPRFFYVSVVPNSFRQDESGQIYNYHSSFHQKLLSIPVGQIQNLSDNEGQKDWYMYERAGDDTFNGKTAKVFINQRPWEFPNGTWEYRYVFELPEKTVITGAYIEGGPSDAQFTLPVLTQIMNTLVIQ